MDIKNNNSMMEIKVIAIGFLGGLVFLCVQLRLYIAIFLKWRKHNRTIVIHDEFANCPDGDDDMEQLAKIYHQQRSDSLMSTGQLLLYSGNLPEVAK